MENRNTYLKRAITSTALTGLCLTLACAESKSKERKITTCILTSALTYIFARESIYNFRKYSE